MRHNNYAYRILFEKAKDPDKTAIAFGDRELSYRELQQCCNCFSAWITNSGIRTGSRIILVADKSEKSIAIALGIMLSGCTYIPVDAKMPNARLSYILETSKPDLVIYGEGLNKIFDFEILRSSQLRCVEDIFDSISKNKSSACIENVSVLHQELLDANSHVAYCIFTSGSTGKPKGVMISHASACDFYDAFEEVMLISESSVCLNTSEMHFDVSFMDLFFPLYKGSCLHVMPGRVTARRLLSLIEECGITHFTAVSSLLTMITKSSYFESINSSSVQRIMTGAEILNKTTIEKWLKKNRQALIVNGYGPTETTVICTWFLIMYAQLNCYKSFPIGTALDGTVADILVDGTISKNLNVEGELIISGPQVMLGYMDDEQQTARSMLYANGRKYYRTGDICKKDSSNILHVLGRIDHEVKVSGFRVHLSEVKRVLEAVDFVKEVMVCTNKGSEGETIIVAALVFDRGYTSAGTKLSELNGLVEQQLPYYMIPTHIVEFKELPKLNNGKVDVKLIEKNIEATHRTNTLSY